MAKETKIGLLAVAAIFMFIFGFKFLQGKNIFSSDKRFYVEYPNVAQLAPSSSVLVHGYEVGVVADIFMKEGEFETVIVAIDVKREIKVPKNAKAHIVNASIMGDKAIILKYNKSCSGGDCAETGDYLEGDVKGLLSSMLDPDELPPYINHLKDGVAGLVDTLKVMMQNADTESVLAKSLNDLKVTLANLNSATGSLDRILSSGKINGMLSNFESISANLKSSNKEIANILSNASTFTDQLGDMDLKGTLGNANTVLDSATITMTSLTHTMESADVAIDGITALIADIKNGEGQVGGLFSDDGLFNKLSEAGSNIDSLVTDIKKKPYRYIPYKSRKKVLKHDKKDKKDGKY